MQRLWARAWIAYLAAGVLATTVYFMLGPVPAQNVIYDATALSSALAILIGIRRWNPSHRTPWLLLAAAQGLMFLGELVYDWYDLVRHVDAPVPSLADAGFLAAYPFLIAGVVMLTRDLSPRSDRGTIVDATIVATGLGLLWWILVVLPTTRGSEGPVAEQLTTLAYPLMDVLLLFVLVRLAFERGVRTPAFRLLTLSIIATLAADVAYALTNLVGGYVDGSLMDLGWMAGFLFMGAAALHPSMGVVADQDDEEGYRPRFGRVRIAMLTVASLMAPVALAIVAVEHAWDAVPRDRGRLRRAVRHGRDPDVGPVPRRAVEGRGAGRAGRGAGTSRSRGTARSSNTSRRSPSSSGWIAGIRRARARSTSARRSMRCSGTRWRSGSAIGRGHR